MGLEVRIANLNLRNPTILASGILGISAELLKRCENSGAGAVTTKSFCIEPRPGHNNPITLELECGLINAVGLANPGYKAMEYEFKEIKKLLKIPVIASIFGKDAEEYKTLTEAAVGYGADAIELNVSCPNVEGKMIGFYKNEVANVIHNVKEVSKNLAVIPKLTPQATNIADIALACEEAGADAISAINTVGPAMVIDIETAKPILAFKKGGLSGPMIRPIAVRCVYEIYRKIKIPIIGIGGIVSGKDAIEMVMAGASAVGIGSAVYYNGLDTFNKINKETNDWMKMHGYKRLEQIRGMAHEKKKLNLIK